jgi:hypothetical protein
MVLGTWWVAAALLDLVVASELFGSGVCDEVAVAMMGIERLSRRQNGECCEVECLAPPLHYLYTIE